MDIQNPVIQLCIEGTRAEFEHRNQDAQRCYQLAWEARTDDYEACIAAHYLARFQNTPQEILHWNQVALKHANAAHDERIIDFYASLYLNLGHAYALNNHPLEAQKYYDLAAHLGLLHQLD